MDGKGVMHRGVVLPGLVVFAVLAYGSAIAAPARPLASIPPHVIAVAKALRAHPITNLPPEFRREGPAFVRRLSDGFDVNFAILERKPGPLDVILDYIISATPSSARAAFRGGLHGRPGARPTATFKPYSAFLDYERYSPSSPSYKPCTPPNCRTTSAVVLVGNVIVSANAGLGTHGGSATEAIKLTKAGIQHLLKVERGVG